MSITYSLMLLPFLVVGLVAHECAHALAAKWLGDHFPRRNGRISLNPFRHMTLLGTAAILVLPFGWARPVEVNPYNFRRPRRDMLLTALAGPAANVLLALLAILVAQITRHTYAFGHGELAVATMEVVHLSLRLFVLINTVLAVINLLPIPPLDGSRIWPLIHPDLVKLFRGKFVVVWVALLVMALTSGWLGPLFDRTLSMANGLVPLSDRERAAAYMEQKLADVSGDRELSEEELLVAEDYFDAAIEMAPKNADAWRGRAIVCERRGNWLDASEAWMRVCELDPKSLTRDDDLKRTAAAIWRATEPSDAATEDEVDGLEDDAEDYEAEESGKEMDLP